MAQEYKPGEIVPESGIYTITHDPVHSDMPHEVTVIKGRRFRPAGIARASHFNSLIRQSTSRKSSISKNRKLPRCSRQTVTAWGGGRQPGRVAGIDSSRSWPN